MESLTKESEIKKDLITSSQMNENLYFVWLLMISKIISTWLLWISPSVITNIDKLVFKLLKI